MDTTRMKAIEESTFFDVCKIGIYSETTDSYGDLVKSWVYGVDISCGAEILNGYEKINGELTFTGVTIRVRLPKNTVISQKDRVKYTGVEYGVKSIKGKYCLVVECEVVII